MAPPPEIPEKGFYYHYKHDPNGPFNTYAYEVVGVGHHTEEDLPAEQKTMVIYRPLYESFVYKNGKMFDVRPLPMFMESVEKDGGRIPRFEKIEDPALLAKLEQIRDEMYP